MTKGKITMNAAKKFFLAGFLAVGLLFTSGCDSNVSYESKSESSSSIEVSESGINTSSSYKETKSESKGPLAFKINDVNLLKGETDFNISITNKTDKETTVSEMTITFKATDDKDKVIREGSCTFNNLAVKLPPGKEIYENFAAEDDKAVAYDNSFNIQYEISNITLNPPID